MKKHSFALLLCLLTTLLFGCLTASAEQAAPVDLHFNAEAAYVGQRTYPGTLDGVTEIENGLVTNAYKVTYVSNPLSDDIILPCRFTKGTYPAGEFFKMNIIVPESYDGRVFTEEELANAPIIIYTPWGGDSGAVCGDLTNVSVRGDRVILRMALSRGWIVIDPGMIGANQLTGTAGEADYHIYGKLPYPIACMKAVIRYLRYDTNAEQIPGDKERIFFLGNSSGGDMATVIGASGNSDLFTPYLEELGAAPGRDDVFCALPSCPVMMRGYGDNAFAWALYGDLSDNPDALEINRRLASDYVPYLNSLGLKAEFDVPEAGIQAGDPLTDTNFKDYALVYYKKSALRFMNEQLGSREAIDAYLASTFTTMYWRGMEGTREVLKPVYGEDGNTVVDLQDFTWDAVMSYNVLGGTGNDPTVEINWQYDHCMMYDGVGENGVVDTAGSAYKNGSSSSFGHPGDFGNVFSPTGLAWIQEKKNITLSDEYERLITLQRNATDPMYFIWGEGATDNVTTAKYWHLRTGSVDLVVPSPNFIALATKLSNTGRVVDAAFMWDEGHQLTSDTQSLFAFAERALAEAAEE